MCFKVSSRESMTRLTCLEVLMAMVLTLLLYSRLTLADPPPFHQSEDYDKGKFGIFVGLNFSSSPLTAPRVNIKAWADECDANDMYIFFCPRGLLTPTVGPVIMNRHGHMVWHRNDFGNTYNLQVQKFKGEDVLTFWAGDDNVVGHGTGYYYILDSSYRLIQKISPVGSNYYGDLHEFLITPSNTVLLTIYEKVRSDMTVLDASLPKDGFVFDNLFQELDLTTSPPTLLFEWRASDHFRYADCFHNPNSALNDGKEDKAFDWFHINSIEKDPRGNYLISARYSNAITYISGRDGSIIWHLGGRNNSFYDLSAGHATDFKWQHHARWHSQGKQISLFDNAAYFDDHGSPARGMLIDIDESAMTAKLVHEYYHPDFYFAESQGSMQMLDNGNAFVGWGNAPAWTEFDANAIPVCDVQFGALKWKEDFGQGAVMSYRTYRQKWKGWPVEMPKVAFKEGQLYVSWNGATEVVTWTLEESDGSGLLNVGKPESVPKEQMWRKIADFPWQGFESSCVAETGLTDARAHLEYRLTAKDSSETVLGVWSVDTAGVVLPFGYDNSTAFQNHLQEHVREGWHSRRPKASARHLLLAALVGGAIGALIMSRRSSAVFLGLVSLRDARMGEANAANKIREV